MDSQTAVHPISQRLLVFSETVIWMNEKNFIIPLILTHIQSYMLHRAQSSPRAYRQWGPRDCDAARVQPGQPM